MAQCLMWQEQPHLRQWTAKVLRPGPPPRAEGNVITCAVMKRGLTYKSQFSKGTLGPLSTYQTLFQMLERRRSRTGLAFRVRLGYFADVRGPLFVMRRCVSLYGTVSD